MSAAVSLRPRPAPEPRRGAAALVHRLLAAVQEGRGGALLLQDTIVLHLDDLVPDEAGEVVLRHGADFTRLLLVTDRRLLGTGRALPHVTAAGESTVGLRQASFEGGPTFYYPADLQLEVVRPAP